MDCDLDNEAETCSVCKLPGKRHWKRNCPQQPQLPPLRRRLLNFTKSAIQHALAGAPTCSDAEIQERLTICRGCDQFIPNTKNPDVGTCAKCGCPTSDKLSKFASKVAWKNEGCPLGKWNPID
jgi:hypothetical protein